MADDDLVTQGARASATLVLTKFFLNIPVLISIVLSIDLVPSGKQPLVWNKCWISLGNSELNLTKYMICSNNHRFIKLIITVPNPCSKATVYFALKTLNTREHRYEYPIHLYTFYQPDWWSCQLTVPYWWDNASKFLVSISSDNDLTWFMPTPMNGSWTAP